MPPQRRAISAIEGVAESLTERYPELEFTYPGQNVIQVESDKVVMVGALVHYLEDQGVEVLEARRVKPSLEDVFVRITGIEADVMRKEKEKGGGQ